MSKNDCRDEEEDVTMKREWRERGNRVGDVGGEGPKRRRKNNTAIHSATGEMLMDFFLVDRKWSTTHNGIIIKN